MQDGDLAPTARTDDLTLFLIAVMRGTSGRARDGGTIDDLQGIAETANAILTSNDSTRM